MSFPSDPALLSPAQRLKLALTPIPTAPVAPVPAAADPARRERGVFAAPVQVSAADRAILEARHKAKLEANRAPHRRDGTKRTAVKDKANLPQSTILTGPPGLTPAEQAKAEATGVLAPARKEAQP